MKKVVTLKTTFNKTTYIIAGSERDKSIIAQIQDNQLYEPHVMLLLSKIIKPHFTCLDIGANIGVISVVLSDLARNGRVYAFEPSHYNFLYLQENIALNNIMNIHPINYGVLDERCEIQFSYVEEVAGCSFMSNTGIKEGIEENVSCIKLDDWVKKHNIKVDFIKLDVEGAEIKALTGASRTLQQYKPDLVIEFNPTTMKRFFAEDPQNLYRLLATIYPSIEVINNDGSLTKIIDYSHLQNTLKTGWTDLYCSFCAYV